MTFRVPERFRITRGPMASDKTDGNNGAFFVPARPGRPPFKVIASDGAIEPDPQAWEHVSVSLPDRCPTWEEMCAIKSLFWGDEDLVLQYHPPRSEWVSNHRFCLHLWRPVGLQLPKPPQVAVGIQAWGELRLG